MLAVLTKMHDELGACNGTGVYQAPPVLAGWERWLRNEYIIQPLQR